MKQLLLCVLVLVNGGFVSERQELAGKVIKVMAGDLLIVELGEGRVINLALSEVDCPEDGQPFAVEAKSYTEKKVLGKKIVITISQVSKNQSSGYVALFENSENIINHLLVHNGLAWHVQEGLAYTEYTEKLISLEEAARANKSGLWVQDNPTPPWIFRTKQNMCQAKTSY